MTPPANTYANFVSALAALEVSGVNRRYAYPPGSIENLPASFPMLPAGDEAPLTFGASGGNLTMRCQFIVVYKAQAQGKPEDDYPAVVALLDSLSAALRAAVGTICKGKLTWTARVGEASLGNVAYWAVIADVSGQSF